jgi:hypothetical protein
MKARRMGRSKLGFLLCLGFHGKQIPFYYVSRSTLSKTGGMGGRLDRIERSMLCFNLAQPFC